MEPEFIEDQPFQNLEWEDWLKLLWIGAVTYAGLVAFCAMSDFVWNRLFAKTKCGRKWSLNMQLVNVVFDSGQTVFGLVVHGLKVICGIASFTVFVIRSYLSETYTSLDAIEWASAAVFEFLLLMYVLRSPGKMTQIVAAPRGIIESFALSSEIVMQVGGVSTVYTFGWLRILRSSTSFLVLQRHTLTAVIGEMWTAVSRVICQVLALVLVFAVVVMTFERLGNPTGMYISGAEWTFFDSAYFIIVTITTVGYGDIYAESVVGRSAVLIFIITGILVVGLQTGRIMELMAEEKQGRGRYVKQPNTRHMVVCGDPSAASLNDFLKEVFHGDHADDSARLRIVVLLSDAFDPQHAADLKRSSTYRSSVTYLRGSVFSNSDLARARASEADAFFVLSDPSSNDDRSNILRMQAIRLKCPAIPVYAQVKDTESKAFLASLGIPRWNMICVEELKLGLLANTTVYPGSMPLVMNLLDSKDLSGLGKEVVSRMPVWQRQYGLGMSQELYEVAAEPSLFGMSLAEAAQCIYEQSTVSAAEKIVSKVGSKERIEDALNEDSDEADASTPSAVGVEASASSLSSFKASSMRSFEPTLDTIFSAADTVDCS